MSTRHQRHSANGAGEPTHVINGDENNHSYSNNTNNSRIAEVREKAAEVYSTMQVEAQVYIDKSRQAVVNVKETARETAANLQQKALPYVDTAMKTAQPYVDQAQAVKRGVDRRVEEVQRFDITKTYFFANMVVMLASVLAAVWKITESVSVVRTILIAARDKLHATGISDKVWEMYYYSTIVLEHVPVIGDRAMQVIRIYVEQVADETRKQIRFDEVETKKAN